MVRLYLKFLAPTTAPGDILSCISESRYPIILNNICHFKSDTPVESLNVSIMDRFVGKGSTWWYLDLMGSLDSSLALLQAIFFILYQIQLSSVFFKLIFVFCQLLSIHYPVHSCCLSPWCLNGGLSPVLFYTCSFVKTSWSLLWSSMIPCLWHVRMHQDNSFCRITLGSWG